MYIPVVTDVTKQAAIESMRESARAMTTTTLVEAVALIGGGHQIPADQKLARAIMLDVIEEREGEEIADQLMESLQQ